MSRNWPLKLAISLLGLAMVLALLPLSSSAFTLSNTDLHAWRIPEPQAHPSPLQRTELWAPHWLAASITFGPVQEVGPYGVSAWENAWADFDGDGDLDFVQARTETSGYGGTDGGNQYNAFYTNDGSGNFTEHVLSGLENLPSYSAAAGDFDRDGDMDVAIGNVGQNKLYVNDGTGNFTMQAQFGQESTTHVSWGDCNKDGWVDLAVANRGTDYTDGAQNYLYFNNGDGTFSQQSALGTDATYHITWVDYDADGDLDLAVANLGQNYLYINDGSCNLTAQAQFGNSPTQDIEFGDLDGDGDLDAIVANGVYGSSADNANNYPNQVCWQQNDHSFSCENAFNQYSSRSASIADLDGDGDLDVVITNDTDNQPSILFENDGAGNFTETSLSDTAQGDDKYWKSRGELVDIDADGDKDYIAAQYCHHAQCPVSILLQNQTPLTNPSNTGLVADYRFETCGSSHYAYTGDHTGTLPDGILRGNATITADGEGKIYRAYEGDGSNGTQMTVGDNDNGTPDDPSDDTLSNPALDILGDLTLAAWVNPNGYPSWIEIIVSRSHEGEFWLGRDSNGYLVYAHNSGDIITSAAQVLPGGWHHVALVRTGTSGNYLLRFYVDGELKDTVTYTQDIQETDHLLEIGSCQFVCGGLNFNGKIDEVKIYNRALTDDDILQTYTNENLGLNADGTERCSGWCEPGALSTVQNGSFEDSASGSAPTGWVGGQVTNSTTVDPKPDGSQYGFTWPGEAFYQDIPISAGSDYTVTFHAGSHQPEDGDKTISIQYLDNNHQPLGNPAVHIITKDVDTDQLLSQMRRLHLDAAPTDAAFLRIAIDAGSSDYAKIDAVCVYGEEATATASLGDFVWEDMNGNGIQESGEPGMANVTVELYSGDACSGSAIITTTTDTNGNYSFTNLAPGTYSLKFITPSGYDFSPADQGGDNTTDSDPDPSTGCTGPIELSQGQNDTTWDAGMYQCGCIGDYVWNDANADGIQDANESGIENVTVELYDNNACSGTAIATTTTDADGNYSFENLSPGTYSVKFSAPNGYLFSPANQGDDAADSDADPTTGCTGEIQLTSGGSEDTWDAGLYQPASLGDFVWEDLNGNGIQDNNEPGMDGVTVRLYDNDTCFGTDIASTTTANGGTYTFTDLTPGTYSVKFDSPSDYAFSPANQGDDTTDSDADPTTGCTGQINLTAGENDTTWDAGLTPLIDLSISKDLNDTTPQVGDIVTFTITIYNEGTHQATGIQVTDLLPTGYEYVGADSQNYDAQTGLWTIGALNPNDSITLHLRARILDSGNYQNWAEITAADQRDVDSDPTQDHTVDDLKDGQPDDDEASAEPDAVIQANAQLGDFVWWDIDRDGVQDPGEPGIPNVSLSLSGTSTDATTTDASGIYTFSNLLAGDYTVTVDPDNFTSGPLKDWEPSPQNAGDDTADSDGDPTTHDASVTLATNEINKTIDFGFTITTTYTLTKQLNTPDPVRVGHPISFTIRITNTGKTWLSQLPLRDSYNTGYLAYGYNGQYANPDSDDHQNDGQIDWSDVLGGNPLAPGASISVTVYFTAKADTTSLPGGKTTNSTQTHDGLADPDGPNGPLGALEPLPTQSDEAQVAIIQPTGLIVQRFRALAMGQWVRLSWHTLNEADIVGFRLLRTDAPGHPFQLITPFIPAQVTGQPEGATYMLMDELPSEEPAIYQLEVIHQQGQTDTIQAKTLPWFSIFFQK